MAAPASIPERLRSVDWQELMPRLLLAAARLHQRYLAVYRGAPEPKELVQDAVTDLLTGVRALPDEVPLVVVVCKILESKVSNYLKRQQAVGAALAGQRYVPLDRLQGQRATDPAPAPDPAFQEAIRMRVRGDSLLEQIVALLLRDPLLKAADLAAMLEVEVEEIYRANRRLRRRLARFKEQAFDPPTQ